MNIDLTKFPLWVQILIAIGVLIVVPVAVSFFTADRTADKKLQELVVETGSVSTNSNAPHQQEPWRRWMRPISNETDFIGLTRRIRFRKSYAETPVVSLGFHLISLRSLLDVAQDFGYTPSDYESSRLRELSVQSFIENADESAFDVRVGIALPKNVRPFVDSVLKHRRVEPEFARAHRTTGALKDDADITAEEVRYMLNYYKYIGTLDVSWIAAAKAISH